MMNKRVMKIVDVLLKHDAYITIDHISEELHVSNKTIRNDLQLVGEWLSEQQLTLIKKTGVGVLIEGSKNKKLHILESIQEKNKKVGDYSPQARKLFIGMQLCVYENCRIFELSKQLYVSRATIHKDIQALDKLLYTYHIQLHRKNNHGLSIEGKERYIRNFLIELMLRDNGYFQFMNIIRDEHYECDGSYVYPGLEVSDDEVKDMIDCILSAHNRYIDSLNFQSLVLVLLRIFVTFQRMQDRHFIKLSQQFLDELSTESCYQETRAICDRLGNHYRTSFPELEIRYLQVYFLSLKNTNDLNIQDQAEATLLTDLLLASWSEQLHLPFSQDEELRKALYLHLCPALTRFRHGIPNENPLLPEIYNLYSKTFEVTKNSIGCIEDHFHCEVSEDETGYLALHLAASIERMKKPLQTLLITHNGTGAGTLLQTKLAAQIPEINIASHKTFFSIDKQDTIGIELIISTLDLQLNVTIPMIRVHSILHDYDILRLKDTVKALYNQKNDPLNFKTAWQD